MLALIAAICLPPDTARAQGRVDLRYVFTAGESVRTRLTIDNTTKTEEATSGAAWQQRQRQEFVFTVLTTNVDAAGVGTLQMTIESLKASQDRSGEGRTEFDSTKAQQEAGSGRSTAELAGLVGQSITMVVAPDGTVREMRGMDVLARAMTAQLGEHPLAGPLVGELTRAFEDDSMREALQAGVRVLPGRPVRRGETWTTRLSQSLGPLGEARSTWRHRLADIKRERFGQDHVSTVAKIESEIEISMGDGKDKRKSRKGDEWSELALGIKVRIHKAAGKATTLFDTTRGRAVRSESRMTMPVEVLIEALQTGKDDPSMCQEIESSVTHELLTDSAGD